MSEQRTTSESTAPVATDPTDGHPAVASDLDSDLDSDLTSELLVEEISIDGMCGVY